MTARDQSPSVALVGIGGVCTSFHIPALKRLGVRVVAAADPKPAALIRARDAFPRLKTVGSPSELPRDVDCAVVSSPTAFHAAQTIQLLERGVDVLCEKPLGCTLAEAREMARVAEQQGRVLQAGYFRRFHDSAQRIATDIREQTWGAPASCLMVAGHVWSSGELSPSTMERRLSGGGTLIDIGVHLLDRALSWFDEVSLADYLDDNRGGMEANAVVRLTARSGSRRIPVTLLLSRTRGLGWNSILKSDRAWAVSDMNEGSEIILLRYADGGEVPARMREDVLRLAPHRDTVSYFASQWREFASRRNGGPEVHSDLEGAIRTTGLVEECYAHRRDLPSAWENDPSEDRA